jgi:hypothetical protein
MASKYDCVHCRKQVAATKSGKYRQHSKGDGEVCGLSGVKIPEHVLAQPVGADDAPDVPRAGIDFQICPQCDRKVKLTRMGYFEPHATTLRGGDRCLVSGVRAKHARRQEDVPLPGDDVPRPGAEVPKVKAQEEITSPAPTSASAAVDGTRKELPPSSGGSAPGPAPTSASSTPSPAADPAPGSPDSMIDWSKVGDLKNLPPAEDPKMSQAPTDEEWAAFAPAAGSSASTETSSPGSETTSTPSQPDTSDPSTSSDAEESPADVGPFHLAPLLDESVLQPFSHISQPFPVPPRIRLAEAMSDRGKEIATRLRETFYAYTNRDHSSNRSAQRTLGPSGAGTPCDRQIAMKLMGIPPVNPQEGWAPFVGTAVHKDLAAMFEWANGANSGRYVTEMRVQFPSEVVPYGTLDLLDRVLFMVDDHKLMGRYSLDKLIQNGPSETYRVQLQIYGLGAVLAGEKVREVALIAWPRQESNLDKLYVHVEPFDRKVAEAALKRVERIAGQVERQGSEVAQGNVMGVARSFPTGDDCKWCDFHLKGDKEMKRGCPGK